MVKSRDRIGFSRTELIKCALILSLLSCQKEAFIDNSKDFIEGKTIDGLIVQIEENSSGSGYQIVWTLDPNRVKSSNAYKNKNDSPKVTSEDQFEIKHVESNIVHTLKFKSNSSQALIGSEWHYECTPNEQAHFEVKRTRFGQVKESQVLQMVCPMDIVMGNPKDEELLNQELNRLDRKKIVIGKWIFPHDKEYNLYFNRDTEITVNQLHVIKGQAQINLNYEANFLSKLQKTSQAIGVDRTIRSWSLNPQKSAFLNHQNKNLQTILSFERVSFNNKIQQPLRHTFYVLHAKGRLLISSKGAKGGDGLSGDQIVTPDFLQALKTPAAKGDDGSNGVEELSVSIIGTEMERHYCFIIKRATAGSPGKNGTLAGVPGTHGGPGISNMLISFYVTHPSSDFRVKFLVTPGDGGLGGRGIEGQKGGPGGIGGIKPCERRQVREDHGPSGLDAPKGEDGRLGDISHCNGVTVGSNLSGKVDLNLSSKCPNQPQLDYQAVNVVKWDKILIQNVTRFQTTKEIQDINSEKIFIQPLVY